MGMYSVIYRTRYEVPV